MLCEHLFKIDLLSTNGSAVSFTAITHQISNENWTSVQESVPVLGCDNIELSFDGHDCCLTFTLSCCVDPSNSEQIQHLFRVINHFRAVMNNSLSHLLRCLVIAIFQGLLVSSLRFQASCPTGCEFIRLQFWRGAIEYEDGLNPERKHGCRPCEDSH